MTCQHWETSWHGSLPREQGLPVARSTLSPVDMTLNGPVSAWGLFFLRTVLLVGLAQIG